MAGISPCPHIGIASATVIGVTAPTTATVRNGTKSLAHLRRLRPDIDYLRALAWGRASVRTRAAATSLPNPRGPRPGISVRRLPDGVRNASPFCHSPHKTFTCPQESNVALLIRQTPRPSLLVG